MQSAAAIVRRPQIVPSPLNPDTNPFGLLNINGAEESLRDVLPRAKVEYLATGDAPPDFKKGMFTFSLGYQKQSVDQCVILALKYSRLMWPPYSGTPAEEALCKSSHGIHSTGGTTFPVDRPMQCSQCPHSQWKESSPPTCSEIYSLLAYDLEDSVPFVIGVKRTSIINLRKMKTALKMTAPRWTYPGCVPNACVAMQMQIKPVASYYTVHWPQRGLRGEWLWTRLPEEKARELTKVAMDLSTTFNDLDVQTIVDTTPEAEAAAEVPF